MHFNGEINVVNILGFVTMIVGVLWRLHLWDKTNTVRHVENQARFMNLESVSNETRQEQKKCRELITTTCETVARLDERSKREKRL